MTEVDDWVNGDFENLYTGLVTNDVNHGEFTLTTVSGDQRVVIPENGLYQVVVTYYLDVDNDSDGNQRYQAIGRIRRDRSGTIIDIGEHGTGYSRGQYNDILSRISVTVLGLAAFETDDEIYGELRAHRQTFGFAADVSGTISIIKVGGAKGDDGAAGAAGTDGAAGADGAGVPGPERCHGWAGCNLQQHQRRRRVGGHWRRVANPGYGWADTGRQLRRVGC